ncbi:MAG: hypothetical protein R2827_04295 [Bdellovibrionales bacterium]
MAAKSSSEWDLRQLQVHLSETNASGVFLIVGEEAYLVGEALSALKQSFSSVTAAMDFNFEQVYASEATGESVRDRVETLPMMAEKRMVIVRGATAWKRIGNR